MSNSISFGQIALCSSIYLIVGIGMDIARHSAENERHSDTVVALNKEIDGWKYKKVSPLTRYKIKLLSDFLKTDSWGYYNSEEIKQVQRNALNELEQALPRDKELWTAGQKEVYEYATKTTKEVAVGKVEPMTYFNILLDEVNYMRENLYSYMQDIKPTNVVPNKEESVALKWQRNLLMRGQNSYVA